MLIEYKFKFEKNGLTLTQRVEPDVSDSQGPVGDFVEENSLKASFQESKQVKVATPKSGGAAVDDPGSGGGGFGTAPVTLIGPFIMCCPPDDFKKQDQGKG